MDLRVLIVVGTILQIGHVIATPDLDAVIRRLDEIDAKFARVDALFTGFEQLCQSTNHVKITNMDKNSETLEQCGNEGKHSDNCELGGETVVSGNDKDNADDEGDNGNEDNDTQVDGDTDRLEIVSVHSDGVVGGTVHLSVVYIADESCVSEWFISVINSSVIRTIGEVTRRTKSEGRIEFVSRIELSKPATLGYVLFMINSKSYSAYLEFNVSRLDTQGDDPILPPKYDILDFPRRVEMSDSMLRTEGLQTSITVTDNVVEHLRRDDSMFEFTIDMFNSTSSPPVLNIIWHHSRRGNFSITVNDEVQDQVDIGVRSELAQFGGILTVRLYQNASSYKYVSRLTWGVKIEFLNEAFGGLMPYGTFGLYNEETIVPVRGQSFNALCMAFGVPIPKLTMLKEGGNGQMVEVEPDYEVVQEPFTYKVVNVLVKSQKVWEVITCTASDGNVTQTLNTTFMTVTGVKIDKKKTRLVKNTTDKVIVTCKATGNPVPDIILRTNDFNMTNLLEDARFEHKVTKKKFANKVTLTMAPPNEDIHSVICMAEQSFGGHFDMDTMEIEIFPPKIDPEPMYNFTVIDEPYFGYK